MSTKIQCVMCENPKDLKAERVVHKFSESGLDNITLVGVVRHKCDKCGEEYYQYGDLNALNGKIASLLIRKKDILSGAEIRFLRKYLGYSGEMFSKLIGYNPKSFSRLENGHDKVTVAFDRMVRFFVWSKKPDRDYDLHDSLLSGGISFRRIELVSKKNGWEAKAA